METMCDPEVKITENSMENENPNTQIDENLNDISTIKTTKQKKWVKCDLCNVPLSSKNSIQRHILGKRHTANLKKVTTKNQDKIFQCEICRVKTNGAKQLEDHLKSNKHACRVEMLERRVQLKEDCMTSLLVLSFIFAILINVFYLMFTCINSPN